MSDDIPQTAPDPPISRFAMDILDRLSMYRREYADRSSLPLHPETPGITHGLLLWDVDDAIKEIKRLRAEVADRTEEFRQLNEGVAHNAQLDRDEIDYWKYLANDR